jgi:hypothetical protein
MRPKMPKSQEDLLSQYTNVVTGKPKYSALFLNAKQKVDVKV